jgi:hypothetical protein
VAEIREPGSRDEADVPSTEDDETHGPVFLTATGDQGNPGTFNLIE